MAAKPPEQEHVPEPESKDFSALRVSGAHAGASKLIGLGFTTTRDRLARLLVVCGVHPNHLTLAGLVFTCAAGYCLLRGASQQLPIFVCGPGPTGWWPWAAAVFLILSGACDMLDGAVARVGSLKTQAGGVLDSSVDRLSDIAIYLGCFLHFATEATASVTYQLLAAVALANAVLISYVKARAEDIIADCSVGYWLRGERFAAVLIGCLVGHVPAVLWQMAVSCLFTVWRRMTYGYQAVRALETGRPAPPAGPKPGWVGKLQLWRHPRGSIPYDIVTGTHIAYIIFSPCVWPVLAAGAVGPDPVAAWLAT